MKSMAIFKSKFNKNKKLKNLSKKEDIYRHKPKKRKPSRLGWQYQMNIYIFFFQLST